MRKVPVVLALSLLLWLPQPAAAWNNAGHLTVAAIAYMNLKPGARAKVDAIMRMHPDFGRLAAGVPANDPNRLMVVFCRAATWPDTLRNDDRFVPGETLGRYIANQPFPTNIRGESWHYINIPFSPDGTRLKQGSPINALEKIDFFRSHVGNQRIFANHKAWEFSWLLHLVGDIHQPLHSVARFTRLHRDGDRGGNDFLVTSERAPRLHSYWDRLLGTREAPADFQALAQDILQNVEVAPNLLRRTSTRTWINESAELARTFVYTLGRENPNNPPTPSAAYEARAISIARERVKLAGLRLAAIFNSQLE